jgi:hypothetical protein
LFFSIATKNGEKQTIPYNFFFEEQGVFRGGVSKDFFLAGGISQGIKKVG